MTLDRWAV